MKVYRNIKYIPNVILSNIIIIFGLHLLNVKYLIWIFLIEVLFLITRVAYTNNKLIELTQDGSLVYFGVLKSRKLTKINKVIFEDKRVVLYYNIKSKIKIYYSEAQSRDKLEEVLNYIKTNDEL